MKSYTFAIGPDPRETARSGTKGNGEWSVKAQNYKDALRVIFGSMTFPGEATGRSCYNADGGFIPGVSLQKHEREVIQVWSDCPEAQAHIRKEYRWVKDDRFDPDEQMGLLMELDVTKIGEYLTPVVGLLTSPGGAAAQGRTLSPMGASIVQFEQQKAELQHQMQLTKFEVQQRQWEVEKLQGEMKEKVKNLNAQLHVMNTYLHGTRDRSQLLIGKRAKGPYHVFQQRQFLNTELALLANLQEFDFEDLPGLEKWLVSTGQIWKLLPYERCILVTRIRSHDKDYHDPFVNWWKNQLNRQNMIWIRDGENVFHVDVDFNFDHAVFPAKDQFDRVYRDVMDHVYKECFKPEPADRHRWMGERKTDPPMGQLKPYEEVDVDQGKPWAKYHFTEDERYPYTEVRLHHKRFTSLDEWMDSPECSEVLKAQIVHAVQGYLREKNKENMRFCVLLQGIVDNTEILDIPKGTDLFNWESISDYFVLIHDYTHALIDRTFTSKMDEYFDVTKIRPGDWVLVWVDEKRYSFECNDPDPWLFYVAGMKQDDRPRKEEHKGKYPYVMFRPLRKRGRDWHDNSAMANRTKDFSKLILNPNYYSENEPRVHAVMRVPCSPGLAAKVLEDRQWKLEHRNYITLMAQYDYVLKTYLTDMKNQTKVELKVRPT